MSQKISHKQELSKRSRLHNKFIVYGIHVLILFTVFLSSCIQKAENESRYFNIDSLLQIQTAFLSKAHASLIRETKLGSKSVTKSIKSLDSVGWTNELSEFGQLGVINKPTYKGSFTIDHGIRDANSNLRVTALANTKKLPVESFKIYYQDQPFRLRKIEASFREGNSLYKNARMLTMEFQDFYNKTILTSYSITGGQKMIGGDSIEFTILGKIQVD